MRLSSTFATCLVLFYLVTDTKQVVIPPSIEAGPLPTTMYLGKVGSRVVLSCEASGNPAPSFAWFRNGQRIPNEDRPLLTLTADNNNNDNNDNNGYYRCAAITERYGTALSNVTRVIQAVAPQFVETPLTTLLARIGDKMTIQCSPRYPGTPPPQYDSFTWKENNAPITFDKRRQMDDQGTLYFAAVTNSDIGKIRKCTVGNKFRGTAVDSGETVLTKNDMEEQVSNRPPAIFFYSNMSANTASSTTTVIGLEGHSTSLKCFFSGSGDIGITWKRANSPVLDYPRVARNDKFEGELLIDRVQRSDEDDYICEGLNSYGVSAFRTRFIVHAEPRFLSDEDRPRNVNVTVGQDVVVRCRANAEPAAQIQWYRDGVLINQATKDRDYPNFYWNSDSTELKIKEVCKSNCTSRSKPDIMVIQCNASNIHNYTFVNGYINVFEETKFIKGLPDQLRFEKSHGEQLVLTVQAESDPTTPIAFEWYRNGERISDKDPRRRITYGVDGKSSTLTINSTIAEDIIKAIYTCNATNGVSTASTKTDVDGPDVASAAMWIALLALLIVLFIVGISLAIGCALYQNRGEDYPVDETERKQGNNPEQDLEDADFHPFQRKERGSQSDVGSLHSRNSIDRQYDEESTLIRERRGGSQGQMYN